MTGPKLTGARCQCPQCGELFSSVATFDRHRIGAFAGPDTPNTRRCMTVEEMMAEEWPKTDKGAWLQPARRPAPTEQEGPSSPEPCRPYRDDKGGPEMRVSEARQ